MDGRRPEDGSVRGLPQLRGAAPDVVVVLVFALGLSVEFAARLAFALRVQADLAIAAHRRGLRRDGRRRRGAAPLVVVALVLALLLRVVVFASLAFALRDLQADVAIAAHRRGLRRDARRRRRRRRAHALVRRVALRVGRDFDAPLLQNRRAGLPLMTSCDDSDETTGKTDYLVDNSWYLIEHD